MYKNFSIQNVSAYAVYMIPLLLLTGPAIPDIVVSFASMCFIYILISNNDYKFIFNTFSYIFFIFCIYLIFSSLISQQPIFSLQSSLFYFRFGLLSLLVWYLIEKQENFMRYFLYFLVIAFLIALFSGIYQYIFSETIFGKQPQANRLLLLASDNEALGQWLSRLFPLLVALMMYNFKPKVSYYLVIFFLLIGIDTLVYLSGERTSLGLMFVSSIFIIVLMKKLRLFRIITIFFSVLIIILISIYNPEIKERNVDYTITQLGLDDKNEKINLFSPLHENYIMTSLSIFEKNKVFGVGPNNYRHFCGKNEHGIDHRSCSTHPHHNYIQVLAETGIIGFLFIMLTIIYLTFLVFKYIYSIINLKENERTLDDFQICLLACFLCSFLPTLPTMNFFNNWINIIYYLPVGFFLHSLYKPSS